MRGRRRRESFQDNSWPGWNASLRRSLRRRFFSARGAFEASISKPRPEEHREAMRLEGWTPARTRGHPSRRRAKSAAPQDKVRDILTSSQDEGDHKLPIM